MYRSTITLALLGLAPALLAPRTSRANDRAPGAKERLEPNHRLAYLRTFEPGWSAHKLNGKTPIFHRPLQLGTWGSHPKSRPAPLGAVLAEARLGRVPELRPPTPTPRPAPAAVAPSTGTYDVIQHQRHAMIALLAWSGASIAAGAAMLFAKEEPWTGFGIQNIAWGAIDAIIGGIALGKLPKAVTDPADAERRRRQFRRILWINTGLDVLWILTGAALVIWGNPTVRAHGYGVLTQGGFLLVFDGINAGLTYRR